MLLTQALSHRGSLAFTSQRFFLSFFLPAKASSPSLVKKTKEKLTGKKKKRSLAFTGTKVLLTSTKVQSTNALNTCA
jgi:hypothetical protein